MLRFKTSRMTVVVGLAAALIIAAGGGAIASNMGFKINMPLVTSTPTNTQGFNWLSIPYINPYGNAGNFCRQLGLPSVFPNQATVTVYNPCNNSATTCACTSGAGACDGLKLVDSAGACASSTPGCLGFLLKGATLPSSIVIVGSHAPALTCNVPVYIPSPPASASGEYWWSTPYHTTAITYADVCTQGGFPNVFPNQALLTMYNPVNNNAISAACGTAAAGTTNLVLGRGLRIRLNPGGGPRSFIPAHF